VRQGRAGVDPSATANRVRQRRVIRAWAPDQRAAEDIKSERVRRHRRIRACCCQEPDRVRRFVSFSARPAASGLIGRLPVSSLRPKASHPVRRHHRSLHATANCSAPASRCIDCGLRRVGRHRNGPIGQQRYTRPGRDGRSRFPPGHYCSRLETPMEHRFSAGRRFSRQRARWRTAACP